MKWLLSIISLAACHLVAAADAPLTVVAGDLELTLHASPDGITLEHLRDTKLEQELFVTNPLPLFTLKLRRIGSTNEVVLAADRGWRQCQVKGQSARRELRWSKPVDQALAGLSIIATASADTKAQAISWKLRVENQATNWSLWRVVFPQVALADLGTNGVVLFPLGPGQVQRGVWSRQFSYGGNYPDGWCTMQFMSAYREGEKASGLYVAAHDPWGSPKELALKSDPAGHSVRMSFDHPAVNMGLAGNDFNLEGEVVWRLLRGDWFDAATFYQAWARKEAKWWPRLQRDGRSDTPRWMRELNAWAMTGGAPDQCVTAVADFRRFLDLP
ncbi:MAG TPA: DUF6259 domain-containing protein, partial [Candidatus Sulfotelmatobacter sp.]|nr:DUF6259 domain-containing protein [Candidatus Sulfotelmatobacter sp.]